MSDQRPANELRILVIDDDPEYREMVRQAVEALKNASGYYCTTHDQAFRILEAFQPNVIVLDANLKGAASRNFIRRLRAGQTKASRTGLALFTSAKMDRETVFKLCEVGCEGILQKPFGLKEFGQQMIRMLRERKRMICTTDYFGPDRRVSDVPRQGPERRRKAPPWSNYQPKKQQESSDYDLVEQPAEDIAPTKPAAPAVDDAPEPASTDQIATPATVEAETTVAKEASPEPEAVEQTGSSELEVAEPEPEVADPAGALAAELEEHREWLASAGRQGAKARLREHDMAGLDLAGIDLISVDMRGADLEGSNLSGARLHDTDLREANLSSALCNSTEFMNAKLRHTKFRAAQLKEANLRSADVAGADFANAILTGADFTGANFLSTNLAGADVAATNLSQAQADKSQITAETKLPPGVRRNAD